MTNSLMDIREMRTGIWLSIYLPSETMRGEMGGTVTFIKMTEKELDTLAFGIQSYLIDKGLKKLGGEDDEKV